MFKLISKKQVLLFVVDFLLISICLFLAHFIRTGSFVNVFDKYTGASSLIILSYLCIFYVADLYNIRLNFRHSQYVVSFALANVAGAMLSAMAFYMFPPWKYGRGIWLIFVCICFVTLLLWRVVFEYVIKTKSRPRSLLIVGAGSGGRELYNVIKGFSDYRVIGFIDDREELLGREIGSPSVIGGSAELFSLAKDSKVDIIVCSTNGTKSKQLMSNLIKCKMDGVAIYDLPLFYEEVLGKIPIHYINDEWVISTPFFGVAKNIYNTRIKRLVDIALSVSGIVICLPLMVLIAVMVKLTSKGPVFFKQQRVGLNGRTFNLLKFRSMRSGAEEGRALWAEKDDRRVTSVGKVLRKLRLDEIPQFINVLRGEMSFIGPRPERPEFVHQLEKIIPYYSVRHVVRPGITGWAQVNFSYGASVDDAVEKLRYEFFYIKNLNPVLDIRILLKTIRVVLFGVGAR